MVDGLIAWEPYCWIAGNHCIPTYSIRDQRSVNAAEETTHIIYNLIRGKYDGTQDH